MAFFITDPCVGVMDRSCIASCPVDCIYEGDRSMYINPDECIDCGACEQVCPVEAVKYEFDLDDEVAATRTREWVELHDANGGAKKRGRVGVDHPEIARMTP